MSCSSGASMCTAESFGLRSSRDGTVDPELQKIIDASPTGTMTFLVTKFGKPFTAGASAIGFADDATRQDSLIAQHMGFERLVPRLLAQSCT